jgi:hypothetical protein
LLRHVAPVRAFVAGDAPHSYEPPLDERETEVAVDPNPLRVVVVVVLRGVLVLVEVRPVSGTELEGVADVPVREKIGRGQALLLVLLLVHVQPDL